MTEKRILLIDLLFSLALVAFTLVYAVGAVDFEIPPFEDAAMLMRYADHLAHDHGVVWNIGEPPVDGATDFLFMVTAAALIKVGMPVGRAVRGLGLVAHLWCVLLVYWVNRRVWHASPALSAFSGAYLAVGTGLSYVAAFFGTPFFALAAATTWMFGLILLGRNDTARWLSFAFALSGLVTALIRPEGAILAVLFLVAVVVVRGVKGSAEIIAIFVATFLILGGAYFLWHWGYFGYPLPNPFYKKGGGLHWDSFEASLMNTLRLCLPFTLAFILGLAARESTKRVIAFLIPVVGFAAAFILVSDETNFGARFQYALVPIVLMSWVPLVRTLAQRLPGPVAGRERKVYVAAAIAVGAGLLYYSWFQNCFLTSFQQSCQSAYEADGRYDMGRVLAEYREKGYVIATSEAGLLPYYSGWRAIDTWGLNDQWITHNGEVTDAYLARFQPHLIAFHAYYSPLVPPKLTTKNLEQDWFRMTITLKTYAESRNYLLAAVFGDSPYDTVYYYVRPDFADSHRIVGQISGMTKYYWFATGKRSINYADLDR